MNTFTTYLSSLLAVIADYNSNHAQKWGQICCKCVQLVRGSSFRNDLLQNPYFKQILLLIISHTTNDIIFINCYTIALLHTPPRNKWEINCSFFLSFLLLSLRLNIVMCFLVYLKPFFAFCPFLKTKQNRGRQKTRTARSGRETPTQDLTGQSRNLLQLRLPEGNAEIRFCVEISIQRSIFFRAC